MFTEAERIYDRASFFRDMNHVSLNCEHFSFLFPPPLFHLKSFAEGFHVQQIDAVTGVVLVLLHAILPGQSVLDYSCLICHNVVFFQVRNEQCWLAIC